MSSFAISKKTALTCLVTGVLLGSPSLRAQDFQRVAPNTLPPNPQSTPSLPQSPASLPGGTELIGKSLQGLVFVSDLSGIQKNGLKNVRGIEIKNLPLINTPEFRSRIQPFLGKPVSLDFLNLITAEVVKFYNEQDRPLVNVVVPEQDITSGVVQVVVAEGSLGQVRVTGNRWFRSGIFSDAVHLRSGETVDKGELQADLRTLNDNPFHSVDTVFRPGEKPGTTDLWLDVKDRFPLRVYTGYENTGTQVTDENRFLFGMNWGNAFGLDQQINYQYTADPDFQKYGAHSGSYIVPLPWGHKLTFFGLYDENTNDVPAPFNSNGRSWQVSGRYSIPLPDLGAYTHTVSAGYDYKNTNNNLDFGGASVFNTTAAISQFVVGYTGALPDRFGTTGFDASLFLSPGGMVPNNNDTDLSAGTPGSTANYIYSQASITRITNLPAEFSLFSKFTGQVSSGTLFSTETLGLGGYDSVRGYEEREVNSDGGFIMTQEIRTPSIHPLASLFHVSTDDNLQFLAFSDTGWGYYQNPAPGYDSDYLLSSIGGGLRYAITPYLTVRADYGFQLVRTGLNPDYDSHASIGVVLSY